MLVETGACPRPERGPLRASTGWVDPIGLWEFAEPEGTPLTPDPTHTLHLPFDDEKAWHIALTALAEDQPAFARLESRRTSTAISTEEVRELMSTTTGTDPEAPFGRKADGTPRKRPYPAAAIAAARKRRAVSDEDAAALTPNGDPKGWPAEYRAEAARMEAEAAATRAAADRKATRLEERATWLRNAADKLQGKR